MPSPAARALAILLALTAGACARDAPELPLARTGDAMPSAAQAASCADIDRDLDRVIVAMEKLAQPIDANRESNQTLGYVGGVLFLPLLFGLETNEGEKVALDENQRQRDRLLALRAAHACPARPADPATGRLTPIGGPIKQ